MAIVDLLSRYAHVVTAIVFFGGAVFLRFVLNPALDATGEPNFSDAHASVNEAVRKRWAKFVAVGTLILIVSGFWNYLAVSAPKHKGDGPYHALMGGKMLLAFVAFFLSAALSGRSPKLAGIRKNWRASGLLLILVLAGVVFIGSYLKMRGIPVPVVPASIPTDTP